MSRTSTTSLIGRSLVAAVGAFCLWWWITGPLLNGYGYHDSMPILDGVLWTVSRHIVLALLPGFKAVAARSAVGALLVGTLGALALFVWLAGSFFTLLMGSILGPVYVGPYGITAAVLLSAAIPRLPWSNRWRQRDRSPP
jgi:hypothetical protein